MAYGSVGRGYGSLAGEAAPVGRLVEPGGDGPDSAEPAEGVVVWESRRGVGFHSDFGPHREMARCSYESGKTAQQVVVGDSRLEEIWLKAGFLDGIRPANPVLATPIGGFDACLSQESLPPERVAAILGGGSPDLSKDMVFGHRLSRRVVTSGHSLQVR